MTHAWIVALLSCLPHKPVARVQGAIAGVAPGSALQRALIRAFVAVYGVDTADMAGSPADHPTLASFFTRGFLPGSRPVHQGPEAVVCPCDGWVLRARSLADGGLEGLDLAALLGGWSGPAEVAVIYLSPRDLHRLVVPREGRLVAWTARRGRLWPVAPWMVRSLPDVYARNERLVLHLEAEGVGRLHLALVGAFGVGRIEVHGVPGAGGGWPGPKPAGSLDRRVERGDALGAFHLGSTVVLVAAGGRLRWAVTEGSAVRAGELLARIAA